ncbi:hypothetical protein [Parvibaculum sp.]|uniref:hypothetical protein n=1 Tax=Parvibaculum sp. TaxID=2024848 RepID=UPI001D277D0D|nr:hypothetical protein [Parvibaculum sp.]MBX3490869.1 hypothetical protein [Parvibaculum sp.]
MARETLGERFWQAVEITQLSQGAVDNYMRTGEAWPADKRFLNMPFDCHSALNTLDPDRRVAAMTMAQKAKWDRDELRRRVAAWKAGDEKAFDYRHKVSAPERPARKIVDVPETLAGEGSSNGSKNAAVFDATDAGRGLDVENSPATPTAAPALPSKPTATERLNHVLALLKEMRNEPGFLAALDPPAISAVDCGIEGQWLVNVGTETRHRQDIEFDRKAAPRRQGKPQPAEEDVPVFLRRKANADV